MKPDEYWYVVRSSKFRLVCIRHGKRGWALYLDEVLIDDGFGCADEAALRANKKNFSDDRAIELFSGISVPADLHGWATSRPETPFVFPNANN